MRVFHINNTVLLQLAKNSTFNYLTSLQPLRAVAAPAQPTKKPCNCGAAKAREIAGLTSELYAAISKDPQFILDMQALKKTLKVEQLIISFGAVRTVL
jgi:hypothetical protein